MLTQDQKDFYEAMNDGVYIVDRQRVIMYWNKAAERIAGYTAEEVIGKSCADNILIHVTETGVKLCTGPCPMSDSINNGKANQARVYLHHKEGHRIPVYVRTAPFLNQANSIVGGIELFSEDAPRIQDKKSSKKSQEAGQQCSVTQLPNRSYLARELETDLNDYREHGYIFGVIQFHMTDLEQVLELHGSETRDNVIRMVGKTISYGVRPFDVVGRWNESSFLGIFTADSIEGLKKIAGRILVLTGHSKIMLGNTAVTTGLCCAALMATAEDSVESLSEALDTMIQTRSSGPGNGIFIES
ncbi:MAG: diguanylate cyclase [Candidatus Hydrogenedens sp.]|jgi:PAS domain S-box-containing protein/diguanylate cyclase (GGDEF)-like protein|nr:diguanylate cyclase [Candidatus Hydrogenedens sp.]